MYNLTNGIIKGGYASDDLRAKQTKLCRIEFLPPEWQPTRGDDGDDVVIVDSQNPAVCASAKNSQPDVVNVDADETDDEIMSLDEIMDDEIIEVFPDIYPDDYV